MNVNHWSNIIQTVELAVLILGACLTYRGWKKDREKDREATRFNKKIEYLSEAYEGIALATDRGPERPEHNEFLRGIERAAAIIQLYGEPEEIESIYKKIKEYNADTGNPKKTDVKDLVTLLRNNLREHLSLPRIKEDVISLRMIRTPLQQPSVSINSPSVVIHTAPPSPQQTNNPQVDQLKN